MYDEWINGYERVSQNALSAEWFVSPLEYFWPDGKELFDKVFPASSTPNKRFDELVSPELFKSSMQVDFRAKMLVLAFMRQDISKTYGLEIESGLMHLYRLDFLSCMSQWIYVIEGYTRRLFQSKSKKSVDPQSWKVPTSGNNELDGLIKSIMSGVGSYLKSVVFQSAQDFSIERLNRHLLVHGNVENKNFFSQKNCLQLMFVLDALVVIEMVKNGDFPTIFNETEKERTQIEKRKSVYLKQLEQSMADENLLKIDVLAEHVASES